MEIFFTEKAEVSASLFGGTRGLGIWVQFIFTRRHLYLHQLLWSHREALDTIDCYVTGLIYSSVMAEYVSISTTLSSVHAGADRYRPPQGVRSVGYRFTKGLKLGEILDEVQQHVAEARPHSLMSEESVRPRMSFNRIIRRYIPPPLWFEVPEHE